MKALRRSLVLFGAVLACGLGAAQAEVRIMMRTAPGAAVDPPAGAVEPAPSANFAPSPESSAAAAPDGPPAPPVVSAVAPDMPLRRGESEPPASETAESVAASPPVRRPARDLARPAPAAPTAPSPPASPEELSPQDRRAASLYGAAAPAPISSSGVRRRAQSPDEFRERCATDGGLMQGGGKYGLCIIR